VGICCALLLQYASLHISEMHDVKQKNVIRVHKRLIIPNPVTLVFISEVSFAISCKKKNTTLSEQLQNPIE